MRAGEILRTEAARLQERDRERVAHGERGGGARSGGDVVRAGFFAHAHVEVHVALARERRVRPTGEGDQGGALALDGGQDHQHLVARARVGDGDDDVVGGDHAEIPVRGLRGMDEVGGGAGRGEGGGDLAPDMAGFAHAGDDDPAARAEDEPHGFGEGRAEPLGEGGDGFGFDAQGAPGALEDAPGIERAIHGLGCGLVYTGKPSIAKTQGAGFSWREA